MNNLFLKPQQSIQNNLLNQQQINQAKINDLLNQSAEALMCGPTCQKEKITEELKQKYLDAQTNLQIAPIKLEETKKNYYVYTQGESYYDNILEEDLKEKADKISSVLEENFNEELASATTMSKYYNTAIINSNYVKELLQNLTEENDTLKFKLRNRRGDILTNDRKTYYETNALDTLTLWYKFWWYIYYILVLVFLISSVLSASRISLIKNMVIFILLIFYPYYIDYIVKWITNLYMNVYNNYPKNVYNSL